VALWVGWAEICNFLTDSCKFLTVEIIGAQNFNFAPKFPKMGHSQPKIVYFWKKIFRHKKCFGPAKIYRGGGIAPARCRDGQTTCSFPVLLGILKVLVYKGDETQLLRPIKEHPIHHCPHHIVFIE